MCSGMLGRVVLLGIFGVAVTSNPGLACFDAELESSKTSNVCFHTYKVKTETDTAEECAMKCLADPKCQQFVHGTSNYTDPKTCRLSYTCLEPTSFLAGFDGFLRKTTAACSTPSPAPTPGPNSTFVDVFVSGNEGYPCYRIPSALKLPGGLLLLFAEGRFGGDMGSRTDIVYKTSHDEGRSWSPLRVLYSEWEPPGHSWHAFTKNATFNSTRTFWARDGYLDYRKPAPVGLPALNLTLADAEAMCANHTDCFGFEFFAHDRMPTTETLTVNFKVESRFTADRGNIVTLHNPAPVAVDGRALVVFGRNQGLLLSMRALDDSATKWGPAEHVVDSNRTPIVGSTPGPPGGIVFPVQRSDAHGAAVTVDRIAIAYAAVGGGMCMPTIHSCSLC
jgi:hypothetical protein